MTYSPRSIDVGFSIREIFTSLYSIIRKAGYDRFSEVNQKGLPSQTVIELESNTDMFDVRQKMLEEIEKLDIIEQKVVVLKNGVIVER